MSKFIKVLSVVLPLFLVTLTSASDKVIRYWRVNVEDLEIDKCPIDSNANAYYIFDEGYSDLRYVNEYVLFHTRHFRIKILNDKGLDKADIKIMLFKEDSEHKESFQAFRAYTYTLINGKVKRNKLSYKQIKTESISPNWDLVTFTMPRAEKGAIIEVKYKIKSDFYSSINGWDFQHEIPVLRSSFKVVVPEYFKFKEFRKGPAVYTTNHYRTFATLENEYGSLDYTAKIYQYEAENVPAFTEEKFMASIENYIPNIQFELLPLELTYDYSSKYTKTWRDVSVRLVRSNFFGGRMKEDGAIKAIADSILTLNHNAKEQMCDALKSIQNYTTWNGKCNVLSEQPLFNIINSSPGSSADINLALVVLLNKLGLSASPVALSTRDNGLLYDSRPSLSKLNYVIAACTIDDVTYVMDATSDVTTVNVLPERCLNKKGLEIIDENFSWLAIEDSIFKILNDVRLNLDEDGNFEGYETTHFLNYAAYKERLSLEESEGIEHYIGKIQKRKNEFEIQNVLFCDKSNLDLPLTRNSQLDLAGNVNIGNDTVIFSPLFYDAMNENPFFSINVNILFNIHIGLM